MRHETDAPTIRLDDLENGDWYRFHLPIGVTVEAQWFGFDGRAGLLREEGSMEPEFWPCNLLAACEIERILPPFEIIEPICDTRDALDAIDPQPHRDLRFILAALAASAAVLVGILLFCWR